MAYAAASNMVPVKMCIRDSLGAVSIYYVLGYPRSREELEKGHKGRLSAAFGFAAKYIYVPLTILVLILGYVYNGIG